MKNTLFRFGPALFGVLLGWMLFHPPAWLAALGPLRWLLNASLVAGLLLLSVPVIILANLPREVGMKPASDSELSDEQRRLAADYERLGFRRIGTPLRVAIAPEAIVLAFAHEREPVYGTVFRTTTVPSKTSFDMVSILDGDRGGLTTNANPMGATLATGPGGFRQVFPGQSLEQLLRAHVEAIAYLKRHGVGVRPVSAEAFPSDLQAGLRHQREVFLASPVRATLLTFWRSATQRVPFIGRLDGQRVAALQLQALLQGQGCRVF